MLFVDWWFSINVDTLICENEKQKKVNMKTTSDADKDYSNTKTTDKPNQGCSTRKSQKAISSITQNQII